MSKSRLRLIIVLALCMLACLFAGCSIGLKDYEDYLDYYNITAHVTYYANGGYFNSSYIVSRKLEYPTETKFYEISTLSGSVAITRSNYNLAGWYEVLQRSYVEVEEGEDGEEVETSTLYFVLDITEEEIALVAEKQADGNYTYTSSDITVTYIKDDNFIESDGQWIMSQADYDNYVSIKQNSDHSAEVPLLQYDEDRQYTSADILEDDTDTYVAAKWNENLYINFVLAIYNDINIADGGMEVNQFTVTYEDTTEEYKAGTTLFTDYFNGGNIQRDDANDRPILVNSNATANGVTFLGYYYDQAGKYPVSGASISSDDAALTIANGGNFETAYTIYALYIPGSWEVIRSADDVFSMLSDGSGDYVFAKDVDCSEYTTDMPMRSNTFNGRIEGCGRALKNAVFSRSNLNGTTYSIFGKMNGTINNLTFEDITVNYTVRGDTALYVLFNSVSGTVNNIAVNNVTVVIKKANDGVVIDNFESGTISADSILYNAEVASAVDGKVTLDGYTVTINGNTVLESKTSG